MGVGLAGYTIDGGFKVVSCCRIALGVLREHHVRVMLEPRLGRSDLGVIGVSLDMLLEILRALESLATKVTLVWFQGHVDSDMRGYMIALDSGSGASTPLARQVQVVSALAANMAFANMILFMGTSEVSIAYREICMDKRGLLT